MYYLSLDIFPAPATLDAFIMSIFLGYIAVEKSHQTGEECVLGKVSSLYFNYKSLQTIFQYFDLTNQLFYSLFHSSSCAHIHVFIYVAITLE